MGGSTGVVTPGAPVASGCFTRRFAKGISRRVPDVALLAVRSKEKPPRFFCCEAVSLTVGPVAGDGSASCFTMEYSRCRCLFRSFQWFNQTIDIQREPVGCQYNLDEGPVVLSEHQEPLLLWVAYKSQIGDRISLRGEADFVRREPLLSIAS